MLILMDIQCMCYCQLFFTVIPVLSGHSKRRPKLVFKTNYPSLNAGQKYCRMLQGEHSAKLSTFIKLSFVTKIFVFSIFEWSLKTGFTVIQWAFYMIKKTCLLGFHSYRDQ